MKNGPFEVFTRQLEEVANQWPNHHEEVRQTPHASTYEAMANLAISEVARLEPSLPEQLTGHNAQHGGRVISRYLGISALVGQRDQLDTDQLETIMRRDESFEPLSAIAGTQNKLAYRTEVDLGLGTRATGDIANYTEHYQIVDGAMTIPELRLAQARHKIDLMTEGQEIYNGKCAAERSGSLHKIYHSFLTICLKDEALFHQTLTN